MKKIILSMAMLTMVGATATAQENNDGLTPNRPLTSGELFQGMSRAIPTGRVYCRMVWTLPLTRLCILSSLLPFAM